MASKVPPVIVPPEISTVPSSFRTAYSPAFVISSSSIPRVVEVPTVIVEYSLLEFFKITVCPLVMLIPSPSSDSNVSEVAVVTCVIIVSCERSPEVCVLE